MRDQRKCGRELALFGTAPVMGPGLPYWLPDGAAVRHALEEYIRGEEGRGGGGPWGFARGGAPAGGGGGGVRGAGAGGGCRGLRGAGRTPAPNCPRRWMWVVSRSCGGRVSVRTMR